MILEKQQLVTYEWRSLRNGRLMFKTSGEISIMLVEFVRYTAININKNKGVILLTKTVLTFFALGVRGGFEQGTGSTFSFPPSSPIPHACNPPCKAAHDLNGFETSQMAPTWHMTPKHTYDCKTSMCTASEPEIDVTLFCRGTRCFGVGLLLSYELVGGHTAAWSFSWPSSTYRGRVSGHKYCLTQLYGKSGLHSSNIQNPEISI